MVVPKFSKKKKKKIVKIAKKKKKNREKINQWNTCFLNIKPIN